MSGARSLALVGFMASGKSQVGALTAARLVLPFVDTDERVERIAGPIADIFARDGEPAFRRLERDVAVAALDEAAAQGGVVALGGGAVLSGDVRDALRRVAHVAWLTAPADVLWARVHGAGAPTRPLAVDEAQFARLLADRAAVYEEVADFAVANDGHRPPGAVAEQLAAIVTATAADAAATAPEPPGAQP